MNHKKICNIVSLIYKRINVTPIFMDTVLKKNLIMYVEKTFALSYSVYFLISMIDFLVGLIVVLCSFIFLFFPFFSNCCTLLAGLVFRNT